MKHPVLAPFYSVRSDKNLDWPKFKAFADDKLNAIEKLKFVFLGNVENMVGKGENAGFQHFLLFPLCFQKPSFFGVVKSRLCDKELKTCSFYHLQTFNPLSDDKILDWSKLKQIADDI